jgi:hypothetical protein
MGREHAAGAESEADLHALLTTVIWCKYARGKLLFEVEDNRAELAFDGWAQLLVDGRVKPPPFCCPETRRASYRVTSTDDGRVTVAEAIGICDETQRRTLVTDLEACSATGRRVLPDLLATCPVTGQRVLQTAMIPCTMCQQSVGPQAIEDGRCEACRSLRPLQAGDTQLAALLEKYPALASRSAWRMSQTGPVSVFTSTSLLKRLLVVVDHESLDILRLAQGLRLSSGWTDLPSSEWKQVLGGEQS